MWDNTDNRSDADQAEWEAEVGREEAERDMEPHKREGYAERMYEMADMRRKEEHENGR
jgi:hypothetical protein